MKNLSKEEKEYYERHLRQDLPKESGAMKESGQDALNQEENPGYYHFTQDYNYPVSRHK